MKSPSRWRTILTCLILVVGVGLSTIYAHEWYVIGLRADKSTIADYHFGSEAMIGHGGYHYSNPELYASTAATSAAVFLVLTGLLASSIWFRTWIPLLVALVLIILGHAWKTSESNREWARRSEPTSESR